MIVLASFPLGSIGTLHKKLTVEFLGKVDVLSIHCPLNLETRHLIAERELALMKPTAFVVNEARGAVIKYEAIFSVLRCGGRMFNVFS